MFLKNIAVALIVFSSVFACKEVKKDISQTPILFKKEGSLTIYKFVDSSKIDLDIEIADTDFDIQTGLMYRNSMEKNEAMLFIFDDVTQRNFYMKNTKIPLDIIYISNTNKIVSFQKNTKPFSEASLPSNAPAKYVLEVNAGLSDAWLLAIGDSIHFTKNIPN